MISVKLDKPDVLGMAASTLCALHCTFMPLLFAAQPFLHGARWWAGLDYLFLGLSLLAVWFAARASRSDWVRKLLWLGWVVFGAGLLLESYSWAPVLMYTGSAVLVVTHLVNFRQCRVPNRVVHE